MVGAGGEVGHMIVKPNGYLCTCGNRGCLEQYASATGIVHIAQDKAEEYEGDSRLKAMIDNGDEITAKIVFDLAKQNDYLANTVVDEVAFYLGLAAANLSNALNPEYLVIGGGVSAAGDFLLKRVDENFKKFAFPTVRTSTQLKLAELGNDAGVIGAASLARQFMYKVRSVNVVLGVSNGLLTFYIVIIVLLLAWGLTWLFLFYRRNMYATVLDQDAFHQGMRIAQVIDLRQPNDFKKGHILGARNLPYIYLKQQYGELRPDLPVYMYDQGIAISTQAAAFLAKHGYHQLYILKGGYNTWKGKTKKSKY